MAINGFNYNFLTKTKRELLNIMISREMIELDKSDNEDKKIGDYLSMFNVYSNVHN